MPAATSQRAPAPKKAAKRSDCNSGAPAAKKAKADPNIAGVVDVVEQAADLSEGCRKMLLACVPHCFGATGDERHASQEEVVRMIGEVIRRVEAKLQNAVNDENTKVTDVETSKRGLQQALAEAEAAVAAAAEEVSAKATALAEVTKVVQVAKDKVDHVEEAQRVGDAEFLQAKESKAALEKGIESDLRAIVEGHDETEQHFQALLPLLSGLTVDESLMSALPSTCKKRAADRGSFDAMVLDEVGARLREQAASLAKAVDEATPAAQERASAVEAAHTELSKATEAEKQAAQDLEGVQASQQAAIEKAKAGGERLAAFEPEYTKATQERDEKAATLENFRLYNLACFEQLRNQASAKAAGAGA